MMQRAKDILLRWLPLIVLCVLIFVFSSFSADDSSEQSGGIVDLIIRVFFPDFHEASLPQQAALTDLLTVLVRKSAHFSEYALLGSLAFSSFHRIKMYLLRWGFAVLFAFVYACTDEFHQTFVAGRAGLFHDVLVDTSGAVLGALIACFISVFYTAHRIIEERSAADN